MKHVVLLFILIHAAALKAQHTQTFMIRGDSIKSELIVHTGNLENSEIRMENISNKPIYLKWETVSNTFPAAWDCSMCQHGKCQVGIPAGSVFKKLNAGEEGFIAIHVLPQQLAGSGQVKFKIYDKEQPGSFKILTFIVKVL